MKRAEEVLARACDDKRSDELPFVNLGSLYLSTERPGLACKAFQRAVEINPNHAQATADYIIALAASDDRPQGLAIAEQFLRQHPGERSVLAAYAYVLGVGDSPSQAEKLLDYDTLIQEVTLDTDLPHDRIASFVSAHPSLNENPVSKATYGGAQTGEFDFNENPEIESLCTALVDAVERSNRQAHHVRCR